MKESPIKTERKTLHLPEDTVRALNKLAAKNGTDFSKEVRRAIDEYLDLETTAENIDMINGVIRQELSGQLKALGNRLAGLINRLTIISAAGYYANIAIIADLIDQDRYVLFTSHSYKKLMNNEIETGLSIITSSYLRSESMITAVEENIHYLNPPVADVFRGFLAETNMISADVKQALSNMKPKLDNYVFREWVDAAIACQDDKSLKSTLTPIIGKLSDMRIVAAELDYLLYEPFKEFITMAFLLIGNITLLAVLEKINCVSLWIMESLNISKTGTAA